MKMAEKIGSIIKTYRETGSITATVRKLEISKTTVKQHLKRQIEAEKGRARSDMSANEEPIKITNPEKPYEIRRRSCCSRIRNYGKNNTAKQPRSIGNCAKKDIRLVVSVCYAPSIGSRSSTNPERYSLNRTIDLDRAFNLIVERCISQSEG